MKLLKKITLQISLGLLFAWVVYKMNYHGYYAGYVVGAVLMLIGRIIDYFDNQE